MPLPKFLRVDNLHENVEQEKKCGIKSWKNVSLFKKLKTLKFIKNFKLYFFISNFYFTLIRFVIFALIWIMEVISLKIKYQLSKVLATILIRPNDFIFCMNLIQSALIFAICCSLSVYFFDFFKLLPF